MSTPTTGQPEAFAMIAQRLFDGDTVSLTDIKNAFGVTRANARKWADRLAAYTRAEASRRGRESVWSTNATVEVVRHRAVSLRLATQALAPFAGTPWHDDLCALADSYADRVRLPHVLDELLDGFAVVPAGRPARDTAATLRVLLDAWERRVAVHITYQKADRTLAAADYDPCGLLLRGDHMLIAARKRDTRGNPMRHLRLDRVRAIAPLGEKFSRPSGWRAADMLQHSFGVWVDGTAPTDVAVRVTGPWVTVLENFHLHHSQIVTVADDGQSALVQWHVRPCVEIATFLAGLGADAMVLQPEALRDAVTARIRDAYAALSAREAAPRTEASNGLPS